MKRPNLCNLGIDEGKGAQTKDIVSISNEIIDFPKPAKLIIQVHLDIRTPNR
jgi:hypothetical protein